MIKKIFIIIFVTVLITSCGKKDDPVFNQENQNTKINFKQNNIQKGYNGNPWLTSTLGGVT